LPSGSPYSPSVVDKGYAWPSQDWLSRALGVSVRQVQRIMVFMEARGHVRAEHHRGSRNRIYPIDRRPAARSKSNDGSYDADGGNMRRARRPIHYRDLKLIEKEEEVGSALTHPKSELEGWRGVDHALRAAVGRDKFEAWFRNVKVAELSERAVALTARSTFMARQIEGRFGNQLLACWRSKFPSIERVEVRAGR
jgi:hypothetical protein